MTGAEVLAWLIISYFLVATTWDLADPDAVVVKINSWPRAILAVLFQIGVIVGAASVLALSTVSCILLGSFFILGVIIAASR